VSAGPGVAGESAVIVEVPEAEPLVGTWRLLHDSSAALGVPAHVTVLYPFVPPDRIGRDTHDALRELVTSMTPFPAELRAVDAFGDDDVVYLAPEPAAAFRALTVAVWARFPAHPPYEGRFDDLVPHLTVADAAAGPGRDLRREVDGALASHLPLPFRVTALSLFVSSGGRWSSTARFRLGGEG
jgi:2'-5' RNA ligase